MTSALYFTNHFRDTLKRMESEQRQLMTVLILALISPERVDGLLPGLRLDAMQYMDSQALGEHVTQAVAQVLETKF